jgi:hypothetical protein
LFVRRDDEEAETVIANADDTLVAPLSPVVQEIAARGALHLALRWIFSHPFGSADVRAFRDDAARAREPASEEAHAQASPTRRKVALVSGITALGVGVAGLSLSSAALATQLHAESASQQELDAANQRIKTLNRASFACYGVALAAGLTWAWARFWPESGVALGAAPTGGGSAGFFLSAERRF